MARQLEEQGISPGLVLIIDLAVPGSGERLNTRAKLSRFFENIREGGLGYLSKKVREKSAYFWEERFLKGAVYPAMLRACLRRQNSAARRAALLSPFEGALADFRRV